MKSVLSSFIIAQSNKKTIKWMPSYHNEYFYYLYTFETYDISMKFIFIFRIICWLNYFLNIRNIIEWIMLYYFLMWRQFFTIPEGLVIYLCMLIEKSLLYSIQLVPLFFSELPCVSREINLCIRFPSFPCKNVSPLKR